MKKFCLLLLLTISSLYLLVKFAQQGILKPEHFGLHKKMDNIEAYMNFTEMVRHHGHDSEIHKIETDDDYILTFFRISAKNKTLADNEGLPVVYLQHGLLDSSTTWLINDYQNAPAYMLANRGYDVWLGNSRGNRYSREHKVFDAEIDPRFWEFSHQNMSKYDLPAAFKYITEKTNQKINYIGHSQGTTIMFAALAERCPDVVNNLHRFFAVAPVTSVEYMTSPLMHTANRINLDEKFETQGKFEVFEYDTDRSHIITMSRYFPRLVTYLFHNMIGDSQPFLNNFKMLDVAMSHFPASTSLMNFQHWKQKLDKGFKNYDYGSDNENIFHYGSTEPPTLDLSKIKEQVFILYGDSDRFTHEKDLQYIFDNLKNAQVWKREINAGHFSLLWGKDFHYIDELILDAITDNFDSNNLKEIIY